jgi:hypothetical protein
MINFLKDKLALLALSLFSGWASRIKFAALRNYVQFLINEAGYVVDVVLDNNPDNAVQFQALWQKNKVNFIRNTIDTTISFADKDLKNPKVKYVTTRLLRDLETVLTTGVVTEGSQLEKYMETFDFKHIEINKESDIIY